MKATALANQRESFLEVNKDENYILKDIFLEVEDTIFNETDYARSDSQ